MYDPEMVRPMREELTRLGFAELRTPADVDAVLSSERAPTLVVVNSVCGCAARNARPAAADHLRIVHRHVEIPHIYPRCYFLRNALIAARKSGVLRLTAFTSAPNRSPSSKLSPSSW